MDGEKINLIDSTLKMFLELSKNYLPVIMNSHFIPICMEHNLFILVDSVVYLYHPTNKILKWMGKRSI